MLYLVCKNIIYLELICINVINIVQVSNGKQQQYDFIWSKLKIYLGCDIVYYQTLRVCHGGLLMEGIYQRSKNLI
jgi:hypothetical protein